MKKWTLIVSTFLALSLSAHAEDSLLEQRVSQELEVLDNPFALSSHKVNYILPVTYNSSPNEAPFINRDDYYPFDNLEAKFQVSLKFPVWYNMFGDNGHLYFAYTNQSYWQVYNQEHSSPFRETNHEPEALLLFNNDWQVGRFESKFLGLGIAHQSNGRSGTLSRSWNRIYGLAVFDHGPFVFSAKVWWRLPEDPKKTPEDAKGDDNPDINKYMGNFELYGAYAIDKHRFTLKLRNNLRSDNKGSAEFTYSYPLVGHMRLYVQYFNGYGESLIDYNVNTNRLGVGVSINDIF
ncbi:phospholipase A [Shewanella sp. 202IG2-18]|uniref:phospholipase A n=1 Tax=Parashewanella hymeniacidonis TaxID=2807618 RepID=UPI001960B29B|nr:phospholipase A [Parashewanella hymeniacidonis]MBM7071323.1 phospholipase A [Parashewanella hymeniacidonis]